MKYETIIGLEVHVELATKSKLFCPCSTEFGSDINENVCPICSGMPGTSPMINKKAVELGIAAGLLTNSAIARRIAFDKKNYFYPDLPSGYQVTQLFSPICKNGWVEIETDAGKRRINLTQIHIEEDAGKLIHDDWTDTTLVDFNRASVPLIEIVTNPDFRSGEEVVAFLEKLRSLLSFAGVSDCKMQEGSMRCDINLSVREKGTEKLGTRTEIKNMNSLKAITAAIAYESRRHIEALETGDEVLVQETRRWDDSIGETFSMRGKEDATDYRFCPDPDIMPVFIGDEWIDSVRDNLPETAQAKFIRLTEELDLSEYDSEIITRSKNLSDIFDETLKHFENPKEVANWVIVELLAIAKGDNKNEDDVRIDCRKFAKLIELVENKTINRNVGKQVLSLVLEDDIDPVQYIEENKLGMISDTSLINEIIKKVLWENPKAVEEYRGGSKKVQGFFIGQIMRKLGGKANPQMITSLLRDALKED